MAILRWSPFIEVETLHRQLDKMFDDIAEITPTKNTLWKPAVELQDNGNNLTLKAEIPGVEAKDLDISVLRDAVVIRGEHNYENKTEKEGFFRSEFRYGRFERVVDLPVAVQNDKVEANFNNGILTLTLPKVEEAKNRVFKVNLAGNEDTNNTETNNTETK
ncbi:Hsp20/alpha crystallin family protein [Phormidium sp. LEGE 05292]|uniref:Hsp20/alpha crystallin family protein n=1 Tax=[Phormidium] sp. LEGE 05292 TaxID=767427 RepID=UPI001882EFD2|nr:Hsp20/alpha crystallin family protein [Phormidium sp. LEGE 05292]MBE9226805.1 Hsp20/alpha crystallin family protein [Phormidium sp. LEGE 05292]